MRRTRDNGKGTDRGERRGMRKGKRKRDDARENIGEKDTSGKKIAGVRKEGKSL